MPKLGTYLKESREKLKQKHAGYSLRDVAKRIGMHHSYLGKLENGEKNAISDDKIHALAREYGVNSDFLFALAGRLSEDIAESVYHNRQIFDDFIEQTRKASGATSDKKWVPPLEKRIGELQLLNRMLRDEIKKRQQLEKELKQKEQERDVVLNNLKDVAIYYLDENLQVVWSSPNAGAIAGGFNVLGSICNDSLQLFCADKDSCPAQKTLEDGKIYEGSFVDSNGLSWFTRSVPIFNHSNSVENVLLTAYDVTKIVSMREELQLNRDTLQSILQDIPALICRISSSGRILHVNNAYSVYCSKSKEELIGSNFLNVIPERQRKEIWSKLSSLTGEHPSTTYEHEVLTPEGQVRWQRWTGRLVYDSHGNKCYQAIGQDITEEHSIRRRNTMLATIVENTSNICVIKDLNLRVIATNMAFVAVTGHKTIEDLIGKTDAEIFDVPPDTDPIKGYMDDERKVQGFPKGKVLDRYEEVILPDGKRCLYHTRKFPVYGDNNELIATANISTNLTQWEDKGGLAP